MQAKEFRSSGTNSATMPRIVIGYSPDGPQPSKWQVLALPRLSVLRGMPGRSNQGSLRPPYIRSLAETCLHQHRRFLPNHREMKSIQLNTPRRLYQHDHKIAVYCPDCDRWKELEIDQIMATGKADKGLPDLSFRCGGCGGSGEMQIRTPAPTAGQAHQYTA